MDSLKASNILLEAKPAQPIGIAQAPSGVAPQVTDQKSFSDTIAEISSQTAPAEKVKAQFTPLHPLAQFGVMNLGQELPPAIKPQSDILPLNSNIPISTQIAADGLHKLTPVVIHAGKVPDVKTSNEKATPLGALLTNPSEQAAKLVNPLPNKVIFSGPTPLNVSHVSPNDLVKQLQPPLLTQLSLQEGSDVAKTVDKSISLLIGSEITKSEVGAASRSPDSNVNLVLTSDSVKLANENVSRLIQAPKIHIPLRDSNWGEQFSNRISWISKNNISSAQIKITPAHLGPIEVKISVQNDQTTVSFISNHALVRDAIEANTSRLRDQLAEGGYENVDVDVSSRDDDKKQDHTTQTETDEFPVSGNDDADNINLKAVQQDWSKSNGIDYFV